MAEQTKKERSKDWQAGAEMMRRFVMEEMTKALKTIERRRDRAATELADMANEPNKKEFAAKAAEYSAIKYEHFTVNSTLESYQRWDAMRSCFESFQTSAKEYS